MTEDFTSFVYWVLGTQNAFKGVVFGGLMLAVVLPALLELFNWRRG
jgi:phosphoribosylamine-glycine ligase